MESMRISKLDSLNDQSEVVKEVLGEIPGWTVRWGLTLIFAAIVAAVVVGWMIKYPDIIRSSIVITSQHPPVSLEAEAEGALNLLVKDKEPVKEGQILATLENPANTNHVLLLAEKLQAFNPKVLRYDVLPGLQWADTLELGALKNQYSDFAKAYMTYADYCQRQPVVKEIAAYRRQIVQFEVLLNKNEQRRTLIEEEITLVEKDRVRTTSLKDQKVLSERDFESSEKTFLLSKQKLGEVNSLIASTQASIAQLETRVVQLKNDLDNTSGELKLSLIETHEKLLAAITLWRESYIIESPMDGTANLFHYWSNNQLVHAHDEIVIVIPEQKGTIIGKVLMPLENSGKVKPGQRVNIKLKNFPPEEFGVLVGKVRSISTVPRDNQYAVEVELPQGLRTTFNREMEFKQQMQGSAEIVTEDISLLGRLLYQLRYIFTTNTDKPE